MSASINSRGCCPNSTRNYLQPARIERHVRRELAAVMAYLRSLLDHFTDPAERLTEILFGLIMVMTCTLGAAMTVEEGTEATHEMLLGALGCNVAWGLINAVLYPLDAMFARGRSPRLVQAVLNARDAEHAFELIEDELEPALEGIASAEERDRLYRQVLSNIATASP